MDASKLTQMRAKASNNYKSNWQPRDASEVTMRKLQQSQKHNASIHQGPVTGCCTSEASLTNPTNGFSTDYSQQIVFQRKAGCAQCNDTNFGAPGGVQLLTVAECETIRSHLPNPVKGVSCYCSEPGIYKREGVVSSIYMQPSYTGWRNQTPVPTNGTLPSRQIPNYPSA